MKLERKTHMEFAVGSETAFDAKVGAMRSVLKLLQKKQSENYEDFKVLETMRKNEEDFEKYENILGAMKYSDEIDRMLYKLVKVIFDEMNEFSKK